MSREKQNEIFEALLKHHNIEDHFSHKFKNFTTPGRLIKFSESLKNLEIQLTEEEVNWLNLKNLNNK